MNADLARKLGAFRDEMNIKGKGALAVVIHVTRYAKENGLPLKADSLITEGSGQVLGLGKGAVQKVLNDYGITQVLAEEGGRTSRGGIGVMRAYVEFLNGLHATKQADVAGIEAWWIDPDQGAFFRQAFSPAFRSSEGFAGDYSGFAGPSEKAPAGIERHDVSRRGAAAPCGGEAGTGIA